MATFIKKSISIVLILVTLFSVLVINSSATETEDEYGVMPRWSIINSVSTSFTISGINSTSTVLLLSQFKTDLYITIEFQKEESTVYKTLETWTKYAFDTQLLLEETRLVNIFADYRIKVTCVAGNEQHITFDYP